MSRSLENILLYLSAAHEENVRGIFTELERRGFPRQNQTPHISITFAPKLPSQVTDRAAELMPALMPANFSRVGTVIFGTKRKQSVAWLLETSDELEIAAREISALNPEGRGPRWTPHLTMGLRLPKEIVPEYVRALDELSARVGRELTASQAGHWKSVSQEFHPYSTSLSTTAKG